MTSGSRATESKTVLVLDGRAISSLAIARELDREGMTVHSGETFRHTITGHSQATTETHVYPSPDEEPAAFKQAVSALVSREQFDFVIPVRDATTTLVAELAGTLPASTGTLLDSPATIERLQDKKESAKLAVEAGVPTPATYFPDEDGIRTVQERASFPVLVKPTNASGARGIRRVDSSDQLPGAYREGRQAHGDVIVQEFVDHAGGHYSIGAVFDREGAVRAVHAYEELIQYPDSGGPAIRAKSVEAGPWVHEMLGLLEAVDWTGPVHMDVLFDPDDETYKLLEVNPRMWSSIALTIGSGVSIPTVMMDIAAGNDVAEQQSYRTDQTYRWTVPNELLWANEGRQTPSRVRRLFQDDGADAVFAILSRKDPSALVGTALQSARFLVQPEKRAQIFGRGWQPTNESESTHDTQL